MTFSYHLNSHLLLDRAAHTAISSTFWCTNSSEFSNQLQSSPSTHNISFSKRKALMLCRCTHNPGSTLLWDAAFIFPKDNSLSYMFVLGINMHNNFTHTHTSATWLSNSNYLQVSPSFLNQKWNLQSFCRTVKS